jgi:hypothetical protein
VKAFEPKNYTLNLMLVLRDFGLLEVSESQSGGVFSHTGNPYSAVLNIWYFDKL